MRKLIVELVMPEEYEEDYKDVCAELVIEDFLPGRVEDLGIGVLWDSAGLITGPPIEQGNYGIWVNFNPND